MIDQRQLSSIREAIGEADETELSRILADGIHRLGEHGRDGALALLERIMVRQLDAPDDPYIEEGLAQINAVEGVLYGRLENL